MNYTYPMKQQSTFSEREKEVIDLLLQGKTNKQIALSLRISRNTVEYHLKSIYKKLGVNSRIEAVLQLGKSVGSASNELGKPIVEVNTEPSNNRDKPISRRIPMNKMFYIVGGGLLTTTLIVMLVMFNFPSDNANVFEHNVIPDNTLTPAPITETSPSRQDSSREYILEQIRQLAAQYDQAVQAEKQTGKVEFSKDPSTGEDVFFFKDESYEKIIDLYSQFMLEKTRFEQIYTQLYRDEISPTPFPRQSSAEQDKAYYDLLASQADIYCSLESWQKDSNADTVVVYDPDEGKYIPIFMGEVIARCNIYGQMLEEFRLAPLLANVNKDLDMATIREVVGKPDLRLIFQTIQGVTNAPWRNAALYVDDTGTRYYIDLETARLVQIEPNFPTHPNIPDNEKKSIEELRAIAEQFALANSPRLRELKSVLLYEENSKGDFYFFRWDYRNKDWSGTDWMIMPPFLQVGLLANGDIVIYINTLDLIE
ncbi:MAG: helix-turn-helix transcriptional regulator [Chloroflexi bacterium]|nr:helix-turn-helix transcriptional regulator [Chloroflexota bacterium]